MENYKEEISEIMELVSDILGSDAEGIFISDVEQESGCSGDVYSDSNLSFTVEEIKGVQIKRGASKMVIIPKEKPYVIKMNITDVYDEDGDICCKMNPDDDVLEREIEIYNKGGEILQQVFAPVIKVGKFNGMNVYIQEKIDITYYDWCVSIDSSSEHDDIFNEIHDLISKEREVDVDFYPNLSVEYLSKIAVDYHLKPSEIIELEKEITYLGCNDFHNNNYGFNDEGLAKVFDYGGYYEECHWLDFPY